MDKTHDARRPADKTAKPRKWFDDPVFREVWDNRETRLPMCAFLCGIYIHNGHTVPPVTIEYLRQEYSAAELEAGAAELDADALNAPKLAANCRRGAAFIREQVLQGRAQG